MTTQTVTIPAQSAETTPAETDASRYARKRADADAKVQAKRAAYAKPRPAAGRKPQELDREAVGPAIREKGTTLSGPHFPRIPAR